ncbi:MAG: ATP-binding protein [Pirellulales bacterium]
MAVQSQSVEVEAGPTKRFFVEMLTRDIDLEDAILDLLDNCIDGVVRQTANDRRSTRPYESYWAEITLSPDRFVILDNCGGIPRDIAREKAFMLGRPDLERDKDLETVGMYGIGMKRAIFKMGRQCVVTSKPNSKAFKVTIPKSWFSRDDDWKLVMKDVTTDLEEAGTRIEITELLPMIKVSFDESENSFVDRFKKEVSRLYAIIINKGFTVKVNDETIRPAKLAILAPAKIRPNSRSAIAPYAFKGTVEGVHVKLSVGFHRPLVTEAELDEERVSRRGRNVAGWTVICNDRVVLYADTSRITGWGTANVPSFHNQFRSIAGIVSFRSNDSLLLPLNTTKRGLDTSSPAYLYVLDIMREGTKQFTSYTNKWKAREAETLPQFADLERKTASEIVASIPSESWKTVKRGGNGVSAKKFIPNLPSPPERSATRRIVFSRKKDDIDTVAEHLFGDTSVEPSEVGARCFDNYLEEAES